MFFDCCRFVVIVFPMKSRTLCTVSNMVKAVLGVWLLAFILAIPVIFTTVIMVLRKLRFFQKGRQMQKPNAVK